MLTLLRNHEAPPDRSDIAECFFKLNYRINEKNKLRRFTQSHSTELKKRNSSHSAPSTCPPSVLISFCFLGNQTKSKIGIVYLRVSERVGKVGDEHSRRAVFGLGSRFASFLRFLILSHLSVFGGVRDCESRRFWKTSLLRSLCVCIRGVFVVFGLGYLIPKFWAESSGS